MASLEYVFGDSRQKFELTEQTTKIGRDAALAIPLVHDLRVSRYHCCIQRQEGARFRVMDESSRNGTFLNGTRVTTDGAPLCDGDKITVGQTELLFSDPAMGRTTAAFNDVAAEMAKGKGFHTIMNQIVKKP